MDQESFRKLVLTGSSATTSRGASSAPPKAKTKKVDASQPAFKPRNVKKKTESYRDRATERRQGLAHDYAQVEALAEDFEKRNADKDRETLEEERKYLGGDSEHTVLVKGLDFALLEQNKTRAATSTVDDDELERAFVEGTTNAKKRTREDIIKDLKNKRLKGDSGEAALSADVPLDDVKKTGKFKPIGFKPVGSADGTKKKKVKTKTGEKEGAKKKKKKETLAEAASGKSDAATPKVGDASMPASQASLSQAPKLATPAEPEPEPSDDDMDIFAGVGEYTGVDLGDDSDEDINEDKTDAQDETPDPPPLKGKWIEVDEPGVSAPARPTSPEQAAPGPPPRISASPEREDGEEEEQFTRLAPLASSAIPSIKELLAMDDEVEKKEKRKAKKEKKKGNLTAEGKVDRDYQRLKAYTEKKGGASK